MLRRWLPILLRLLGWLPKLRWWRLCVLLWLLRLSVLLLLRLSVLLLQWWLPVLLLLLRCGLPVLLPLRRCPLLLLRRCIVLLRLSRWRRLPVLIKASGLANHFAADLLDSSVKHDDDLAVLYDVADELVEPHH